jgi:hypothetical protein
MEEMRSLQEGKTRSPFIRLAHGKGSIHQEITNFYNSVQPALTGSSDITVREWLSIQSFEEQQDFGVRVIKAFGGIV